MGKLNTYGRFLTQAGMKTMGQINFWGADDDRVFTMGTVDWRETDATTTMKYGVSFRGIDITEDIKNIISNVYADNADYETEVITLSNGAEVRVRGYYSVVSNPTTKCGGIYIKLVNKGGTTINNSSFTGWIFTNNDNNVWDNLLTAELIFGTREISGNPYVYFGGLLLKYKFSWESGSPVHYVIWLCNAGTTNGFTQTEWNNFIQDAIIDLPDPYGTLDDQNPTGGYGPQDYTSDEDLPPSLPGISAADCGLVALWNPDITEIADLADYLWNNNFFVNIWHKIVGNPIDVILSLGIIPFIPSRSETKQEIVFSSGGQSGVLSYKVPDQMYIVDMGSVHIEGRSKTYMDYSPYCKASIFLPYCGTYAIDVDDIMDADVALEYHVDIYTGACVAYLTITRTNSDGKQVHDVMYQFTGNMLATIPVTAADHRQFIQSLLFMGASIAATVATAGGAAPAIEGAAAAGDSIAISGALTGVAAGSAINTVMSMKPNVLRSGNLSSNAGMLGKQTPTIMITWSNLCRPENEYQEFGMPLYKSGTLSDFSGFTVVHAVHLENIYCTETEKDMIVQALAKGVIL